MREDYGSISIEKEPIIKETTEELDNLSDDILTNEETNNEPIENDGE